MPVRPRWKRRSVSPFWSRYSCCAWPASQRCRCRFAVSTRPARRPGWPRVVTSDRPLRRPAGSRPAAPLSGCAGTADSSSRRSLPGRTCYPCCTSGRPECRRSNLRDERGSATVVAAAMVVVLLSVTGGCACLGAAVVARHRAQAAADLAALAPRLECPPAPRRPAHRPARWPGRCGQIRPAALLTTWTSSSRLRWAWQPPDGVRRGPPPAPARSSQSRRGRLQPAQRGSATAPRRVRHKSRARVPPG